MQYCRKRNTLICTRQIFQRSLGDLAAPSLSLLLMKHRHAEAERTDSITSSTEFKGSPLNHKPSWSSQAIPASRTPRITSLAVDLGLRNRIAEANPIPKKTWEKPWMLKISVLQHVALESCSKPPKIAAARMKVLHCKVQWNLIHESRAPFCLSSRFRRDFVSPGSAGGLSC